ncbi:hypothetical protein BGX27_000864, partial [Mortierella sp. AM989]
KETGITYVTQLLYDTDTKAYYVYYRHGDTDYKLDGPHKTIEAAKDAFQINYKDKFDADWTQRETVSERWTYEIKTYETFEEIEEIEEIVNETEEIVNETEATTIITREDVAVAADDTIEKETITSTITTTRQEETVEYVTEDVIDNEREEVTKVITKTTQTGVVSQPAVAKETSWFRRIASGVDAVTDGAMALVDGVWKRTIPVITTRKAHVDEVCPIAKTSYVYFDEDVYDSVLIEKDTGLTHHMQLLFDSETKSYFVYNRWGEKETKLSGPYATIEAAKASFLAIYKEWYGLEWSQRETAISDRWTYQVKTYETIETTEEIVEIVEDYEVSELTTTERQATVGEHVFTEHSITSSHDDTTRLRTQSKTLTRNESSSGPAHSSGPSSTVVVETKKTTVLDLASMPDLPNIGIDPNTGAKDVDFLSTVESSREIQTPVRPRAWVSLHVGGWQDAPHELEGFMRLDDQSGQSLMENARDATQGKAQEATAIDNLRLPEIVALFAQKLYGHFGEELPEELTLEHLSTLGPHRR